MIRTFPECFDRFLNLGIIPSNSAKSRNNSNYAEILCASNLQNGHAISRILTTPTYRIDLSIPKYHPGAHRAPQRNPISIFPSPSSPRTPHHPPPEPWRGTLERTRARQHLLHILARTLPFPTHSAAKQMAHAGAGFPPRRPVPGGRDGVWEQAGAPAHGHKKRALEHIQDP